MKKVIFDVDGVLLSEKRYFDVSALVVWEWYYSPRYMHLGQETVTAELTEDQIQQLRDRFWYHDKILTWLKEHGVNSNWDMVHAHIVVTLWLLWEQYAHDHGPIELPLQTMEDVQYAGSLLRRYDVPSAQDVYQRLREVVPARADKEEVFHYLTQAVQSTLGRSARTWTPLHSPLWDLEFEAFQDWYFGDEYYQKTYGKAPYAPGKPGFLTREEPLGTVAGIKKMFQSLKKRGYDIAIATGRSRMEMEVPFKTYGWLEEFDPLYVATYSDVEEAEKTLHQSLDKPHPFVYYLGAFGRHEENYADYLKRPGSFKIGTYYIVGDSLADVWCARAMGATMIATLTGLDGEKARPMFEKEHVPYIVSSVEDILQIL